MIQAEYSELTLEIAGRDYKLKTLAQQRDGLQEAASLLNEKIFELKNRGRNLSNEQAAILAALHLSYDLLTERELLAQDRQRIEDRLTQLQQAIEASLPRG
jgi:cell division protein ZapA